MNRMTLLPRHTAALELVSAAFCAGLPGLNLAGVFGTALPQETLFLLFFMLGTGVLHLTSLVSGRGLLALRLLALPLSAMIWVHVGLVGWTTPGAIFLCPIALPMAVGLGWAFILHFGVRTRLPSLAAG